jgi:hypothetical protein
VFEDTVVTEKTYTIAARKFPSSLIHISVIPAPMDLQDFFFVKIVVSPSCLKVKI